jgi:tRNA 2-thiouridine synthesizing protein A
VSTAMHVDKVVDARGQMCPMPVLTLKRVVKGLATGQVLAISATDQGAKRDIPAWADATGNTLLGMTEEAGVLTFYIKKTA